MGLSRRDATDLLRSAGGLLFAVGAVVLLSRKPGHHEWSSFGRLLIVLVPAVVLYVLALGVLERPRDEGDAQPWQSVLMVAAILLAPVALFEFLNWIGANTSHVLYDAGVFALTALLAGYGARRARAPYAVLFAALALLVTWLLVWSKILGHPSADAYRWLLVAAGVLLLLVAVRLARAHTIGAGEVATVGGLTAVAAGVFGVIVGYVVGVAQSIDKAFGGTLSPTLGTRSEITSQSAFASRPVGTSGSIPPHPVTASRPVFSPSRLAGHAAGRLQRVHVSGLPRVGVGQLQQQIHAGRLQSIQASRIRHIYEASRLKRGRIGGLPRSHPERGLNLFHVNHVSGLQHFGWDLYLLVVSLALVWIGSRVRVRGLGYVGGIGLLAFLISVGSQITRIEFGHAPATGIVGWPLALLILGLAGLAAPALYSRKP